MNLVLINSILSHPIKFSLIGPIYYYLRITKILALTILIMEVQLNIHLDKPREILSVKKISF